MGGHGHLLPDKTRTADAAIEAAAELGGAYEGFRYLALSIAALAAGDVAASDEANEALTRSDVRHVVQAFPYLGLHSLLARTGVRWATKHPLRPLPMIRW